MIYIDYALNLRKNKIDVGFVRCDTSGLPDENKEFYTLLITDSNNKPIQIYNCTDIEGDTLFFYIDDKVNVGEYFYSVIYCNNSDIEVFLSKLKFNVKEGTHD